ncbi:MAG TPA: hypothetical protein VFQ38_23895 [Longimicrobiales bacterium]|nr:hypothetical protein [Longimicrobiales bacterium]
MRTPTCRRTPPIGRLALLLTLAPLAGARAQGRAGAAPGPAGGGGLTATAPLVDPSYLDALRWRLVGPSRGGRVEAVAGHPRDRLTFYMGATGGGVWKTEDGGITWRNISDGYFATGSVGAIALAPSNPDVIYVGMGEACFRGDVSHGDGVYKSTDGGKTWTNVGLRATRHIARIRVDPTNPDLVYVAAFGDGFGPSADRGVYRSKDGGTTWEKVLFRDPNTGAIDLVMDPANPRVMYASLLEFRRFPWAVRSAGAGTGLFKTTDGGDHWTELTNNPGLPSGLKGRIGVALSPAKPDRIWTIIDAEIGKKGVYRSDDGGATWQRTSDYAELTQRPWYYHHIFADPKDPETLYVLNINAYKSSDGGKTFAEVRPPHGDNHDLWIDPADPNRMIEGNDGGATVSFNGGRSWSTEMNQPTAQFYHVVTDDQFPYRIYGPQQDEGSISVPSRSDFGAITEMEWEFAAAGESGYIAVRPDDPNIIYGAEHHWLERYDRRSRQKRDISPWPEDNYGWGDRDIKYRFQWTYPVMLSPHDPNTLYATSQVVHRTRNEGQSWEVISPDLTRHDPSKLEPTPYYGNEKPGPYWGPITRDNTGVEWYSVIFAFAESPAQKGVLWAGSDDGYVQVSRDDGKTWTNVTPKELPEFALISIIEPSHRDPGAAYLAATRYKLQDRRPYLFKTTDYGKTWTKITTGIPDGDFTRVIREDPDHPGLLYAGTETGVYFSTDDGAQWQSLRLDRGGAAAGASVAAGLPVVPVHDLAVKDGDLVVATHGRSFWVLDDAALLAQLAAAQAEPVHLFAPRPTVRFRADAALPATTAGGGNEGSNPPGGVVVQWYSRTKPAEVKLAFLDATGREIRAFSSAEPAVAQRGRRGRPGGAVRVPAEAGASRFVWDMRYPGANVIPGTTLHGSPQGPLAAPGKYQVRLTVDGQTLTQPLEIVKDPRVPFTQADLEAQLRFQLAVRDKLTEAHDLVRRIRSMRDQATAAATAARGGADEARLTRALKALNDKLYPIEERLSQYRARATQDLTNYPNGLDDKLVQLLNFAGQADAPPTQQSLDLLTDLSGRLKEKGDALARVEAGEWRPFAGAARTTSQP